MLSAIRDYLQQRGEASLADIARHLDADAEAVRGMLEQWERKGRVERRKLKAECGSSCNRCDPSSMELYVWRGGVSSSR
ncbi:MAG: FeoC-like transcriptional regulator [Candidatus Thiodiazotropha taylori]|nr:FeoC-like transcriptional regulator [Candidatus Thiodiazotropha taylori]